MKERESAVFLDTTNHLTMLGNEENDMDWTNEMLLALTEEANDAFYEWEKQTNQTTLSDDDRMVWVAGYIAGRQNAQGFY